MDNINLDSEDQDGNDRSTVRRNNTTNDETRQEIIRLYNNSNSVSSIAEKIWIATADHLQHNKEIYLYGHHKQGSH